MTVHGFFTTQALPRNRSDPERQDVRAIRFGRRQMTVRRASVMLAATKRVQLTGTTDQVGDYLNEHPHVLGYGFLGFVRCASTFNANHTDHVDLVETSPPATYS